MTRQEQIKYCQYCEHNAHKSNSGQVCGLKSAVPYLGNTCSDFSRVSGTQKIRKEDDFIRDKSGNILLTVAIGLVLAFFVYVYTQAISGNSTNALIAGLFTLKIVIIFTRVFRVFKY